MKGSIWAMQPARFAELCEREASTRTAAAPSHLEASLTGYRIDPGGVAVVPLVGVTMRRPSALRRVFGAVDSMAVQRAIEAATYDPEVRSILLEIDSPGGEVNGTEALADAVARAKESKQIFAWSDGTMASAAYWVGSAASRVYLGSSTVTAGSIGVVATHTDLSGLEQRLGQRTTEIAAGAFKRIASPYRPLSESGAAELQSQVDYLYAVFVRAVATNRRTSIDRVLRDMADGREFIGQQAVDAGLVDGIRRFDDVLDELAG